MKDFKKLLLDFPHQLKKGLEISQGIKLKRKPRKIIICGMGGSALPGELLKMYFEREKIALPLHLHKDYGLPYQAKKGDALFAISYSGNTEETISALKEGLKKGLEVTAISSDGKVLKIAKRKRIKTVIIPSGFPPRIALGLQFSSLFEILNNTGILPHYKKEIKDLERKLKPGILERKGKGIARQIKGKIPLIYASRKYFPLAKIWKISFNEDAKTPAFANYFPELNHNEMTSFEERGKNDFYIIFLKDEKGEKKILKRIRLTESILRKKKLSTKTINLKGGSFSEKIFSDIILANWAAYYLAKTKKVNPLSVKIIEEFKRKMRK